MKTIKRHKILSLLLIFIGLCSLQGSNAYAKPLESSKATEKVAIAFYKTGNIIPNFDKWIRDNAPYNVTPWALRKKIYAQEMERLQRAYHNFDPKKDFLFVKTSSSLNILEIGNIEDEKTYSINAKFSKAPNALYFPYNFLGERIIIMPYGLEKMMQSEITKNQYSYIQKKIRLSNKFKTIIRMKPFKADFSKPYKIDGLEQWVFKTKIASIELWNTEENLIWEYTAPWYVSPHISEIKDLYSTRPKSSNFKRGTIKPTYNKFKN